MKNKFSKSWKGSKQPRKQRKYLANAPLSLKKKFIGANLSKELRKKYDKRSISIRKNDIVKIMRGKFKNKQGKILEVNVKKQKVSVEGIQAKKAEGSKVSVPIHTSNLQIIELNLDDKKRIASLEKKDKELKQKEKTKVK